jgi:hypothetical protein
MEGPVRGSARRTALGALLLSLAAPYAYGQAVKLVNRFNDWKVYAHDSPAARICFATAQPNATEPAGARRDSIYFYVSAWPKDGVKSEISVKIGYPFRKGSAVTVTIGTTAFNLFTDDDKAFVADQNAELKLIEAMKKGDVMIVRGTSQRGTQTTDTYSLTGVSQALQAVTAGCT